MNLRGLLLFSDGRDNGSRYSAVEKAAVWRGICPVNPFALGRETTTTRQGDIAFVDPITVEPDQVFVKTKFKIKGQVRAPGFSNAFVNLRLLIDDKETLVWGDSIELPAEALEKVTIRVPGLKAGTKVRVLFEDREITAADGVFTDDFRGFDWYQRHGGGFGAGYGPAPVAVHLYEIAVGKK